MREKEKRTWGGIFHGGEGFSEVQELEGGFRAVEDTGTWLIKTTEWQRTPGKERKGEERFPLGHVESSMGMSI